MQILFIFGRTAIANALFYNLIVFKYFFNCALLEFNSINIKNIKQAIVSFYNSKKHTIQET